MAGKGRTITVTVEDEVIESLDDFASVVGLSRSASVNMLLKAALIQRETGSVLGELFTAALSKGKADEQGPETVTA